MESFENVVARRREQIVSEQQSNEYRVAVLGPGEEHATFFKRRQILDALLEEKFDAFFPEELVDLESTLPAVDQERLILLNEGVNLIVILNSSEGPLAELASFAKDAAIVSKSIVMCPSSYYSPQSTFPTDVLEQYVNRWRYDEDEFQRCDVVRECMTRARTSRVIRWSGLESQMF